MLDTSKGDGVWVQSGTEQGDLKALVSLESLLFPELLDVGGEEGLK